MSVCLYGSLAVYASAKVCLSGYSISENEWVAVLPLFCCARGYLPRASILWHLPWLSVSGVIKTCSCLSAMGCAGILTHGYLPIERLLEISRYLELSSFGTNVSVLWYEFWRYRVCESQSVRCVCAAAAHGYLPVWSETVESMEKLTCFIVLTARPALSYVLQLGLQKELCYYSGQFFSALSVINGVSIAVWWGSAGLVCRFRVYVGFAPDLCENSHVRIIFAEIGQNSNEKCERSIKL